MDRRDKLRRLLQIRLHCIRLRKRIIAHRIATSRRTKKLYQRQLYRERKRRGEYTRIVLSLKEKDPNLLFEYFRVPKESFAEIFPA